MNAKVTVLYDEGALPGTSYIGAKGTSVLIEVDGQRTLFGAGLRPRYLTNNMYLADVSADSLDRLVIGHRHADQFRGITGILSARETKLDVYAPTGSWGEKKILGRDTGIWISDSCLDRVERRDVNDWVQLSEHLYVTAPIPFNDRTGDECFMVIDTKRGPILLSGCCHPGLDHVCDAVKEKFGRYPATLIGGLHLVNRKDKLADLYAQYLLDIGCKDLYLNHCTDLYGINRIRITVGLDGVHDFYAGESKEFELD
ncbi:MAG: MBL fold metallo-hydrolase [archaeon]|nr:MBL fold metallo-hydrolase [archaeon]